MTLPNLTVSTSTDLPDCDVLVVGVTIRDSKPSIATDQPKLLNALTGLERIGVSGAEEEITRLPGIEGIGSIALVGLGKDATGENLLRRAAGAAARQILGAEHMAILLPIGTPAELSAVAEGASIGAYAFNEFRSGEVDSAKQPASKITIIANQLKAEKAELAGAQSRAGVISEAVHSVRDLVNTPPSHLYPETFAAAVKSAAGGAPVEVSVLAEKELLEGGFGGILGVGQGSVRGPRLVKLSYSPAGASRYLALVGKGITFDSGGLSLKPPASMVGMKYDMTGAATVFAVTIAAAKLQLPVRITAWLCIAENLPSGSSIRPNDVLYIRGGKTVEVLNTDAEGRLVMADGLAAASEEQPDAIVDVATLTGAQRVALGDRYVGTMGNEDLVTELVELSKQVGEQLWPMPLPAELRPLLNSDVADIANVKIGSTAAGMLVAGVFLQEFVGSKPDGSRIPWAHLDIAGPANNEGAGFGYTGKGPTGVAVRTLIALAEQISRS